MSNKDCDDVAIEQQEMVESSRTAAVLVSPHGQHLASGWAVDSKAPQITQAPHPLQPKDPAATFELLQAAVSALPVPVTSISNLQGPFLEVAHVPEDNEAVDVRVVAGFRAHYSKLRASHYQADVLPVVGHAIQERNHSDSVIEIQGHGYPTTQPQEATLLAHQQHTLLPHVTSERQHQHLDSLQVVNNHMVIDNPPHNGMDWSTVHIKHQSNKHTEGVPPSHQEHATVLPTELQLAGPANASPFAALSDAPWSVSSIKHAPTSQPQPAPSNTCNIAAAAAVQLDNNNVHLGNQLTNATLLTSPTSPGTGSPFFHHIHGMGSEAMLINKHKRSSDGTEINPRSPRKRSFDQSRPAISPLNPNSTNQVYIQENHSQVPSSRNAVLQGSEAAKGQGSPPDLTVTVVSTDQPTAADHSWGSSHPIGSFEKQSFDHMHSAAATSLPANLTIVPPTDTHTVDHDTEMVVANAQQQHVQQETAAGPLVPVDQHTEIVPVGSPQPLASITPGTEWELDMNQITIIKRLAVGGFAEVFLGRYQGTLVAVKRLFTDTSAAENMHRFTREVRVLARLRHPNLILFMGYTLQPEPCIISEYMPRGSLYSIMRQRCNSGAGALDAKLQRAVAMSVARGMSYLHSRTPPILHLDLKSPNILIDHAWRIKIADFGLSTTRQQTWVTTGGGTGTPEWMAPEVLRCERYDEKADVYSYGVVLWELISGSVPWADLNPMQVVGAVGFCGKTLPVPETGDELLRQLCSACMQVNPSLRPSFPDVVQLLDQHSNFAAAAETGHNNPAPAALPSIAPVAALPGPAAPLPETAVPASDARQQPRNPRHLADSFNAVGTEQAQEPLVTEPQSSDSLKPSQISPAVNYAALNPFAVASKVVVEELPSSREAMPTSPPHTHTHSAHTQAVSPTVDPHGIQSMGSPQGIKGTVSVGSRRKERSPISYPDELGPTHSCEDRSVALKPNNHSEQLKQPSPRQFLVVPSSVADSHRRDDATSTDPLSNEGMHAATGRSPRLPPCESSPLAEACMPVSPIKLHSPFSAPHTASSPSPYRGSSPSPMSALPAAPVVGALPSATNVRLHPRCRRSNSFTLTGRTSYVSQSQCAMRVSTSSNSSIAGDTHSQQDLAMHDADTCHANQHPTDECCNEGVKSAGATGHQRLPSVSQPAVGIETVTAASDSLQLGCVQPAVELQAPSSRQIVSNSSTLPAGTSDGKARETRSVNDLCLNLPPCNDHVGELQLGPHFAVTAGLFATTQTHTVQGSPTAPATMPHVSDQQPWGHAEHKVTLPQHHVGKPPTAPAITGRPSAHRRVCSADVTALGNLNKTAEQACLGSKGASHPGPASCAAPPPPPGASNSRHAYRRVSSMPASHIITQQHGVLHNGIYLGRPSLSHLDTVMSEGLEGSDEGLGEGSEAMQGLQTHSSGPWDIPVSLWPSALPGSHRNASVGDRGDAASVCTDITFARSMLGSVASSSGGTNTPVSASGVADFSFSGQQHAQQRGVLHSQAQLSMSGSLGLASNLSRGWGTSSLLQPQAMEQDEVADLNPETMPVLLPPMDNRSNVSNVNDQQLHPSLSHHEGLPIQAPTTMQTNDSNTQTQPSDVVPPCNNVFVSPFTNSSQPDTSFPAPAMDEVSMPLDSQQLPATTTAIEGSVAQPLQSKPSADIVEDECAVKNRQPPFKLALLDTTQVDTSHSDTQDSSSSVPTTGTRSFATSRTYRSGRFSITDFDLPSPSRTCSPKTLLAPEPAVSPALPPVPGRRHRSRQASHDLDPNSACVSGSEGGLAEGGVQTCLQARMGSPAGTDDTIASAQPSNAPEIPARRSGSISMYRKGRFFISSTQLLMMGDEDQQPDIDTSAELPMPTTTSLPTQGGTPLEPDNHQNNAQQTTVQAPQPACNDMEVCAQQPPQGVPKVVPLAPAPVMVQRAYQRGRFDVVEHLSSSVDGLSPASSAGGTAVLSSHDSHGTLSAHCSGDVVMSFPADVSIHKSTSSADVDTSILNRKSSHVATKQSLLKSALAEPQAASIQQPLSCSKDGPTPMPVQGVSGAVLSVHAQPLPMQQPTTDSRAHSLPVNQSQPVRVGRFTITTANAAAPCQEQSNHEQHASRIPGTDGVSRNSSNSDTKNEAETGGCMLPGSSTGHDNILSGWERAAAAAIAAVDNTPSAPTTNSNVLPLRTFTSTRSIGRFRVSETVTNQSLQQVAAAQDSCLAELTAQDVSMTSMMDCHSVPPPPLQVMSGSLELEIQDMICARMMPAQHSPPHNQLPSNVTPHGSHDQSQDSLNCMKPDGKVELQGQDFLEDANQHADAAQPTTAVHVCLQGAGCGSEQEVELNLHLNHEDLESAGRDLMLEVTIDNDESFDDGQSNENAEPSDSVSDTDFDENNRAVLPD